MRAHCCVSQRLCTKPVAFAAAPTNVSVSTRTLILWHLLLCAHCCVSQRLCTNPAAFAAARTAVSVSTRTINIRHLLLRALLCQSAPVHQADGVRCCARTVVPVSACAPTLRRPLLRALLCQSAPDTNPMASAAECAIACQSAPVHPPCGTCCCAHTFVSALCIIPLHVLLCTDGRTSQHQCTNPAVPAAAHATAGDPAPLH
jgi:hypothetical protein